MNRTLQKIHSVNYENAGLSDFGKTGSFTSFLAGFYCSAFLCFCHEYYYRVFISTLILVFMFVVVFMFVFMFMFMFVFMFMFLVLLMFIILFMFVFMFMSIFVFMFMLTFFVYANFLLGNYVQRQIERWSKQYESSKTHEIPNMNKLMDWLPKHAPQNDTTTVVHGDFRYQIVLL